MFLKFDEASKFIRFYYNWAQVQLINNSRLTEIIV